MVANKKNIYRWPKSVNLFAKHSAQRKTVMTSWSNITLIRKEPNNSLRIFLNSHRLAYHQVQTESGAHLDDG